MPVTNQSKVINAPIQSVWDKLKNFHELEWASSVLASVNKVGDIPGEKIGAKRILNGAFHETLIEVNPENFSLKYSIDDGPSPVSKEEVSNYIGSIQLSTQSDGTLVNWSSAWESNSDDAVEFCHGIYVALLGALATSFE